MRHNLIIKYPIIVVVVHDQILSGMHFCSYVDTVSYFVFFQC